MNGPVTTTCAKTWVTSKARQLKAAKIYERCAPTELSVTSSFISFRTKAALLLGGLTAHFCGRQEGWGQAYNSAIFDSSQLVFIVEKENCRPDPGSQSSMLDRQSSMLDHQSSMLDHQSSM